MHPMRPQIPIWLKLALATIIIITSVIFSLSMTFLRSQEKRFYEQSINTGTVSLNYFSNNAAIPLIEENELRLNMLIKEVAEVKGLVNALIVNKENVVLAHTDHKKIGTNYSSFLDLHKKTSMGEITLFNYLTKTGIRVLSLSRPVKFNDKLLGYVHVGVSISYIEQTIKDETKTVLWLSAISVTMGILIAILFGLQFSRPITSLVKATYEIGKGNYNYRVNIKRGDEMGILADAFNKMGKELWLKSIVQESFGKYVGTEVLDMILASPEDTWFKGRKSDATVIFTDIRGFTAFSETHEPEKIVEYLNEYFEICAHSIKKYHGFVDKFIGDAVLGVIGVPINKPDHTVLAIMSALDIQEKLKLVDTGNPLLSKIGIGIHTGTLVSGNIGSSERMEYTVIGDTVNMASRLNGLAAGGEIIISQELYDLVKDHIKLEVEHRQQSIKGKSKPVDVYRIIRLLETTNEV